MDIDGQTAAAAAGLPPGVKIAQTFELAQPGAKDGETKIVREGDGSIAAYSWDAGKCIWEKIGTVVDAPEPGMHQFLLAAPSSSMLSQLFLCSLHTTVIVVAAI